jgi:hypothetical protein
MVDEHALMKRQDARVYRPLFPSTQKQQKNDEKIQKLWRKIDKRSRVAAHPAAKTKSEH